MDIKRLLTGVFLVALSTFSTGLMAAEWTVQRASGQVNFLRGGYAFASLSDAGTIKPGDRIKTGANGRVMLSRGEETIVISPRSDLIIPGSGVSSGRTTLLQAAGKVTFEVEKRKVKHFEVQTPFLAAVVKGTRFTVELNRRRSSVTVERGIVDVFDFDTGQLARVRAGQKASTSTRPGAGLQLAGQGQLGEVEQLAPGNSAFGLAGGNGNAYGKSKDKSNSSGQANSNASGNASSNAGGTGSAGGNAGGSSGGNSGGNGNGNGGGNGNGNGGGNGNGRS